MKTLQKGFTLIELLVVIAIIGILSSIVLASLSSARSKGSDAAIVSTLSNMRSQAELFASNNNSSYGTTTSNITTSGTIFTSSTGLKNLVDDLVKKVGTATTDVDGAASSTGYIIAAKLSAGAACVDSTGSSVSSTTATVAQIMNKGTGVCNK